MGIGNLIKTLRKDKGFSQRQLAMYSKVSNTEISRIESGERQKPSPDVLKKLAQPLGVTYSELMKEAGYIEETIEHKTHSEHIYRDENGELVDIVTKAKEMHSSDKDFFNTMHRAATKLPKHQRDWLDDLAKNMLKELEKND